MKYLIVHFASNQMHSTINIHWRRVMRVWANPERYNI